MKADRQLAPSDWLLEQSLTWPEGGHLLDFACGFGRHSICLAKRFDVLAVDRSADALANLSLHPTIKTIQCDLESKVPWPFRYNTFDIVIVTNYLFRPKLRSLFNLVADGGYVAYETFALGNAEFSGPKNPDFLLREGELASYLSPDFEIIDEFHGPIITPRPAVIQRVAARRKSAPLAI